MQEFQDNSQPPIQNQPPLVQPLFSQPEYGQTAADQTTVNPPPQKPKKGKISWVWYVAGGVVLLGIVACLIYFAGLGGSQSQTNTSDKTAAQGTVPSGPDTAKPPASTTPATPSTPAAPSTPVSTPSTPATTPPPQTPPKTVSPPPSSTVSQDQVIKKQAYTLVLTLEDMGTGWVKASTASPTKGTVYSSSHVSYSKGTSFAPVVQNIVSVYRTVDAAKDIFQSEIPVVSASASLKHPPVGDECFMNDSVAINKLLVFRKNNIVVWVMVQQYKTGDPVEYAQIVERKILE